MPTWKRLLFPTCCAAVALAVALAYANHFHNSFHFDDWHTIENNLYIRDLRNVPAFFRSATTFSSLPSNQSYRPLVTTTLALDYRIGGGLDPLAFHADSFALFAIQCVLMFFLFRRILDSAREHQGNRWVALFGTAWYALHAANAETVNYVISRSDILSTLGVVAALQLYAASERARRLHLYLVPAALGVLAKEAGAMFAPLLFLYVGLIERQLSLRELVRPRNFGQVLLRTLPAFVVCGAAVVLSLKMATSWIPGGTSRIDYLITQPFVILHYFLTFFLPFNLTADTDWKLITNPFDDRVILGVAFVATLAVVAVRASRTREARPIAFCILWFFVALLPTSSLLPFSEVMNDHRLYFPFVGLVLAVCWTAVLAIERTQSWARPLRRAAAVALALLVLVGHAAGTHARNRVWRSEETLWLDVTRKSPDNARGLMNYGVALMGRGQYAEAKSYFERSLALTPRYGYTHINLAIVLAALEQPVEAERHFHEGLECQPGIPSFHYFYARWLDGEERTDEAVDHLRHAIELSPTEISSRHLLMKVYTKRGDWNALAELARATLEIQPSDPQALSSARTAREDHAGAIPPAEKERTRLKKPDGAETLLAQSLAFYQQGQYERVLTACDQALQLWPEYPEAFNNKCTALNALGRYAEAKAACESALRLKPDFELARNNLGVALQRIDAEALLAQSLAFYQQGQYKQVLTACDRALQLWPEYAEAFNNKCTALNALGRYADAKGACESALRLKPDYQLARNNLQVALRGIGR